MNESATPGSLRRVQSSAQLVEFIRSQKLGVVDSRRWSESWRKRWVVYADLIAFAARSTRSDAVALNNILRFDAASGIARQAAPAITVHRFSDSTFGIADTFAQALAFGVALHHACLAMNIEYLQRDGSKAIFIHTIVPRITMACGQVLNARATSAAGNIDLDPNDIVAGHGIVSAHELERNSAGGLLTVRTEALDEFAGLKLRGDTASTKGHLRAWLRRAEKIGARAPTWVRGGVVDLPWLLMRPFHPDGDLWCAERAQARVAIGSFLDVCDLSAREFQARDDIPLDASKHAAAAARHAIQCAQACAGEFMPRPCATDEARRLLSASKRRRRA